MHFADIVVEIADKLVDLFFDVVFLVLELDLADLLVLGVEIGLLLGNALAADNSAIGLWHVLHVGASVCRNFFGGLFFGCLALGLCTLLLLFGSLVAALLARLGRLLLVSFSLLQDLTVLLNLFIFDIVALVRVLKLVVDCVLDSFVWLAQLVVDLLQAGVVVVDSRDDLDFAVAQLKHLLVEVYFQLVDGTLKQDHLLTLLEMVHLLTLRHLVAGRHLQVKFYKFELFSFNFGSFFLIFATLHDFFVLQSFDIGLASFALDLSFSSLSVSFGLEYLIRLGLSWNHDSPLGSFLRLASAITTVLKVVQDVLIIQIILLLQLNLILEEVLELSDLFLEEF